MNSGIAFVASAVFMALVFVQTVLARPATHFLPARTFETCEVLEAYFAHHETQRLEKLTQHPKLKNVAVAFRYVEPKTVWFKPQGWNSKSHPNYSPVPRPADAETTGAAMEQYRKHIGDRIERHNKYVANFNAKQTDGKKIGSTDPIHENTFVAYKRAQTRPVDLSKCEFGSNIHTDIAGLKALGDLMKARVKYDQEDRDAYKQARKTSKAHRRKTGEGLNVGKIKETLTAHLTRPQGYNTTKFSAVGINLENGQAMFYTEHYCGSLCAGGNYVFMRREDGKWVYNGSVMTWIS